MTTIATMKRPTGFSDPTTFDEQVEILSYVWGTNRDAAGYDRAAECAQAVVAHTTGRLSSVPVSWLTLVPTPPQDREETKP